MDIGDGVKMGHLVLSQLHMAVCLYFQIGIQAHLIGFRFQGFQQLLLHGMKTLLTAVGTLLHTGLVVPFHQLPYGTVQFQE